MLSSIRALLLPRWDEALGHVALWAEQWARPPCMSIKRVGCVESCGAVVLPAAGVSWERLGRFPGNGACLGGHPAWHPQGTGCDARGCREGASMASDVPAAVPALGLPLWGDQLKQPPHPHQWTEQPFSSSHGSDKGLAGNTGCLVLPQPAPRFSPGRPPPFPGQGPAAAGGPSWSLFTGCFSSLSPRGPGKLPGGKGWPYPVSPLLSR